MHAQAVVVDDDPASLGATAELLTSAGFEVITFDRFESAKAYLDMTVPDVLVADVRLGAFNGLQLVVRSKSAYPDLIAVVLTGFDDAVLRAEAERAGAVFMVKPASPDRLLAAVVEKSGSDPAAS